MNDRELGRCIARYEMLKIGEKPTTTDVTDHLDFLGGYREGIADTEKMLHTPIPMIQLRRAWMLASAYGHLWAKILTAGKERSMRAPSDPANLWTPGLIRELVYATYGGVSLESPRSVIREGTNTLPVVEILFTPTRTQYSVIVHTTTSGDLTYRVFDDGIVDIRVNEPPSIYVRIEADSNIPRCFAAPKSYSVETIRHLKKIYKFFGFENEYRKLLCDAQDFSPQMHLL